MTSYADLLSSFTVTQFDMGRPPVEAREQVLRMWSATFGAEPGLFAAAAAAVAAGPQPPTESAEETVRIAPIRAALGVQTPEEGLIAMRSAQALLSQLARDYG